MKKIFNNIEPFNQFALRDCFYSALLPAIGALGGDSKATAILAGSDMHFSFQNTKLIQHNERIDSNELNKWLSDQNIEIKYSQIYQNEIIEYIRNEINNENLLMISLVDAISTDPKSGKETNNTAGFKHWILFYGYDDDSQEFSVIDHFYIESPIYCKLKMSYDELKRSYNLQNEKYGSRIYILYKANGVCTNDLYRTYFNNWIIKRNQYNNQGNPIIEYVNYSISIFKLLNYDIVKKDLISFIENYYRIMVYYIKEKYVIGLFDKDKNLVKQVDTIIVNINLLRNKFFYIAKYPKEKCLCEFETAIELLCDICSGLMNFEKQIKCIDWNM